MLIPMIDALVQSVKVIIIANQTIAIQVQINAMMIKISQKVQSIATPLNFTLIK